MSGIICGNGASSYRTRNHIAPVVQTDDDEPQDVLTRGIDAGIRWCFAAKPHQLAKLEENHARDFSGTDGAGDFARDVGGANPDFVPQFWQRAGIAQADLDNPEFWSAFLMAARRSLATATLATA